MSNTEKNNYMNIDSAHYLLCRFKVPFVDIVLVISVAFCNLFGNTCTRCTVILRKAERRNDIVARQR